MMKRLNGERTAVAGILAAFLFTMTPPFVFAQGEYDAYTRVLPRQKQRETLTEKSLGFLAFPFDVIRMGMDQTLYTIEHYHIDDKIKWIYDRLTDYGIYPKLQNMANFGDFGAGVDIDLVKLVHQKGNLPYLKMKTGVAWTSNELFRVYTEVGMDKLNEIGPYGSFYFNFEERPEEDFFGIGPNTSRGDSQTFKSEITTLETRAGYSLTLDLDLKFRAAYKVANIKDGGDEGKGKLDKNIAGARGGDFLVIGSELAHDTRDFPDDPHKGGFERVQISYTEGVDGYDFGYFKYRGEAARYKEVFSERQVIGIRFVGEHNDELNDQEIPFFDLARLGGYGVYPSLGDTHRGFQKNRFFGESLLLMNLEYRYLVWQYRDFSLDAVAFWDEGQVFNEISEFQWKDFRESVGGGFRLKVLRKAILSLEIARSDEGINVYARSNTPF